MKKLLISLALGALASGAWASNGATLHKFEIEGGFTKSLSDNGRWGVWQLPSGDESSAVISILNVETGKIDVLPLDPEQDGNGNIAIPYDVTDDGKTVVGTFNNQPAYYKDGIWTNLPMPQGKRKWSGFATSVTPDGRTIVGWISKSYTQFEGCIWVDGELIPEMTLPTHKEMRDLGIISDADYSGYVKDGVEVIPPNFAFFKVSADGNRVLVGCDHNYPAWGCSFIVYDIQDDSYRWIRDESLIGEQFVDDAIMSNNGKWIAGYAVTIGSDGFEKRLSYSYDVDNDTFRFLPEMGSISAVDNQGRFLCVASSDGVVSSLCVPSDGMMVDLHHIMSQKYDIDFLASTGWNTTGYATDVSDDGKTLLAMAEMRGSAYTLSLPVDFWEAVKDVNLLSDWRVIPAPGSEISQVRNLVLYLSNKASVKPGMNVSILDGDAIVAQSSSVTAANASGSAFRISFDDVMLQEGKTYDVVIPAGLFYVEGNASSANEEIRYSYKGRKNEPVAPVEISPEEGSAMIEFTSINPIKVTFDTEITLDPSATAELFIDGNDIPIGLVVLNAAGRTLYAYPAASRMFTKGVTYYVKIPANAIRDAAGLCGNEEIYIFYEGAYEIPVDPVDQQYLFKNDFSSPIEALSKFLQYEGDHNTPAEYPAKLKFDADNTPWNFSVRESTTSYDYCAASHSMYSPAGKSDDWLVLPQLSIENADIYLHFSGQSLRRNKEDYLKVIVWKCDDRFNSLDKATVEKMRAEGTVVFNRQLKPGKNEDMLADEWENFEISLADFKGSKVYIAFVNENEDQSMIFLDNIDVQYKGKFITGVTAPEIVVNQDNVEIRGYVKGGVITEPFRHIDATLESFTTGYKASYSADIELEQDSVYEFRFAKPMTLARGVNEYQLTVDLDGEKQTIAYSITNLAKEFKKKVVIEEGTGAWCGNCPLGMLAFDHIEKLFPGQLVPIAVHNKDSEAFNDYDKFLALGGYPSGRVNRSSDVTTPVGDNGFNSLDGDKTWLDIFQKEIVKPAFVGVTVKNANYDTKVDKILLDATVEFAVDLSNVNYNVLAVAMEDSVPGRQTNYFYRLDDPIYGEWGANGSYGAQGEYADVLYDHVARGISGGSFYGVSGLLPKDVSSSQSYDVKIAFDRPYMLHTDHATQANDKMSIAVLVINAGNGEVLNADVIHTVGVTHDGGAAVDGITDDAGIVLTTENGMVLANGEAAGVEVYTMQGARVANEGLDGLYIVRAKNAAGQTVTAKILVK